MNSEFSFTAITESYRRNLEIARFQLAELVSYQSPTLTYRFLPNYNIFGHPSHETFGVIFDYQELTFYLKCDQLNH